MSRSPSAFILGVVFVTTCSAFAAQQAPTKNTLRFEVASVKPSPDKFNVLASLPRQAVGRLFLSRPVWALIARAYGVDDWRIVGGPSSLLSRRFDILAKAENPEATPAEMNQMLQTLLIERFRLKVHREAREVAISVLKLARSDGRLGPNLKRSTLTCLTGEETLALAAEALGKGDVALSTFPKAGDPCGDQSPLERRDHVKGQPLATLLPLLATRDRPFVEDRTGLTGRYDWDLAYDARPLSVSANASSPTGPPLLVALQQQLGLKLESGKGRVEFLVVDNVELPSPD
jgi:uncharacterized protein (TIGR03435 family)